MSDAPDFVNRPFGELFPNGLSPATPLFVGSNGPPSTNPDLGDGARLPGRNACAAACFSLIMYEGGSVDDLVACAQSREVTDVYALDGGVWVSYVLGAPEFVNQAFHELFTDGLRVATPLIGKRD